MAWPTISFFSRACRNNLSSVTIGKCPLFAYKFRPPLSLRLVQPNLWRAASGPLCLRPRRSIRRAAHPQARTAPYLLRLCIDPRRRLFLLLASRFGCHRHNLLLLCVHLHRCRYERSRPYPFARPPVLSDHQRQLLRLRQHLCLIARSRVDRLCTGRTAGMFLCLPPPS